MTMIGYARVSTEEQHLDLQIIALEAAGCDEIYRDHGMSAAARHRPGFEQACQQLQSGDVLAIWKMDRAFRSVLHAAAMLEEFRLHDIELSCLTEPIDLGTAYGRCMYHVRNAMGQLEREYISERTIAGMRAAKDRGVVLGRPKKLTARQVRRIRSRVKANPQLSPQIIADEYGVSARTIYRVLDHEVGSAA